METQRYELAELTGRLISVLREMEALELDFNDCWCEDISFSLSARQFSGAQKVENMLHLMRRELSATIIDLRDYEGATRIQ